MLSLNQNINLNFNFFSLLIQEEFLRNAFIATILASILCGLIGPFVYVRKIGMIAGSVAHAVLGGMGIAYYFGAAPILGALIAALIVAWIIGWVTLHYKKYEDTITNALWSLGMAVGIIFIFKTPGYDVQLMSYLFGNILMITRHDLYLMAGLGLFVAILIFTFYKELVAISFDEEFSRLKGIKVNLFYYLLLSLVSITTVVLVQMVGLILVITLFILPAAISSYFFNRLSKIIFVAMFVGFTLMNVGLWMSYQLNWPSGATIILSFTFVYLLIMLIKRIKLI
ncbi:MAG: metal ABC transporter permease [Oligoflexia bacterium]|nr:metal ABC transporter permease [Oligoflexia bacterium]